MRSSNQTEHYRKKKKREKNLISQAQNTTALQRSVFATGMQPVTDHKKRPLGIRDRLDFTQPKMAFLYRRFGITNRVSYSKVKQSKFGTKLPIDAA